MQKEQEYVLRTVEPSLDDAAGRAVAAELLREDRRREELAELVAVRGVGVGSVVAGDRGEPGLHLGEDPLDPALHLDQEEQDPEALIVGVALWRWNQGVTPRADSPTGAGKSPTVSSGPPE